MEEHHLLMTSEALSNTENLVEMDFNSGESSLGWPMQHNCTGTSSLQANVGGKLKVTDPCATQHDLFINTVPGHRYEFSADFDVNNSTNFFINYSLHADGVGTYGPVVTTQSLNVTTANRFTYEFIAATHWSRISLRNIGISNVVGTFTVDNIELKHWLPEAAPENELADNISGDKRYELSNHLGNVLNVVTDRKLPEESSTDPGTVGYYLADVVSYSDYDPFGMQLEGRHGTAGYRYGYQGSQKDDEMKSIEGSSYDFGTRMYDPRIGRWLNLDPMMAKFPHTSPYAFCSNSPIYLIDPDGNEPIKPFIGGVNAMINELRAANVTNLVELHAYFGGSGSVSGTEKVAIRYIYSESWGWVDMRHFTSAAQKTDEYLITGSMILKQGENHELSSEFDTDPAEKSSAWDYEDLPSNLLGAYFETYLESGQAEGKDILENLEEYLGHLDFVENPLEKAPNKGKIKDSYESYDSKRAAGVPQNFTYEPTESHTTKKREGWIDKKIKEYKDDFIGGGFTNRRIQAMVRDADSNGD